MDSLVLQLHGISKGLKYGKFNIPDIGDIVPAAFMIQDLNGLQPIGCSYMNNWGCERLGSSVEEINQLGEAYYERYFIKAESNIILQGITNYLNAGDFDKQYNFFQRVKLFEHTDYTWFYTVMKIAAIKTNQKLENKMILLSSPVIGMDSLISRVNKTLDQDQYIQNNYRFFADLTNREKEIISLLANGKSSHEIGELLCISIHTVFTHRKNITRKLGCSSFAELLKFAMAFDLV